MKKVTKTNMTEEQHTVDFETLDNTVKEHSKELGALHDEILEVQRRSRLTWLVSITVAFVVLVIGVI